MILQALAINLVALAAILAGWYQYHIRDQLVVLGKGRVVEPVGNSQCQNFPGLEACEKFVLHQPSGLLYLACGTVISRTRWQPAVTHFDAIGRSTEDYVAIFDPSTSKARHLKVVGFDATQLSLHGMDVVPSAYNPSELWVYLVNHRPPYQPAQASTIGANSTIELFKTKVGGDTLIHVKTWADPVIATPNDVLGSNKGDSFYFTNDHGNTKTGLFREQNVDILLNLAWGSIGYCDNISGCRIALDGLQSPNGIVATTDSEFFVSSSKFGHLYVLEKLPNVSLRMKQSIPLDRPIDNLSVDKQGSIWGAGFPDAMRFGYVTVKDPSQASPSSALRISKVPGKESTEDQYKIEKLFEDDGHIAAGATSAVYESDRQLLYLHGLLTYNLSVCKLSL